MAPACWLRKGIMASASTFVWENTAPSAVTLTPDHSVLPICPWCPSAGTQRKWVQVSPCVGPLRGTPRTPVTLCLTHLQSKLVFTARSYGDFFAWPWNPGLGGWCGVTSVSSGGDLCIQDIPPNFYLPHVGVGSACSTVLHDSCSVV